MSVSTTTLTDAPAGRRVLIVENEAPVRNLLAQAMMHRGFECDTAVDGGEAEQLIGASRYDAVVTQLDTCRHNGDAFYTSLLEQADRPLLVVLAEDPATSLADGTARNGIDEVLSGSVDHTEVAARVEKLIVQRGLQEQMQSGNDDSAADAPSSEAGATGETDAREADAHRDGVQTKHMAIVLLSTPDRSQALAESLASSTMEAVAARNTEELHDRINRQRIDLLVIEQDQPGFLTGIEILERLRDQLVTPESILVADADERLREQSEALGVDRIVSPETELDVVAASARMLLASQKTVDVFIPLQARKLVQRYDDIPPMPQLLVRLASYMEMDIDEIPIDKMAEEISVDQKATTELLKLANSAALGVRQKVTSVFDAVKLLGPKQTILLILTSATVRIQSDLLSEWSDPLRHWFQKRSILIASTASTFARRLEKVSPDTAFVLGLLQDVGVLVMVKRFGLRYRNAVQRLQRIGHTQLHLVEEEDFLMTHADVSAALLQRWDLPKSLVRPVLQHHKADEELERSKTEQAFHRVMQIGEALANLADLTHPVRQQMLNRLLAEYGSDKTDECRTVLKDSVTRTAELAEVFSVPPPDQQTLDSLVNKWPYVS